MFIDYNKYGIVQDKLITVYIQKLIPASELKIVAKFLTDVDPCDLPW